MECQTYLRNIQDLLSDGKTPYERRFGEPFKGQIISFGSLVEYYPISAKDQSRIHPFGKKVLPGLFLGYALHAVRNLEGWHIGCRHWGFGNDGRFRNLLWNTQSKGSNISQRKRKIHFSSRRWTNQTFLEEIRNWEHPPWYGNTQFEEKVTLVFLENQKGLLHHVKTSGCRWSDKWFLVHVRKLHIPPSRWTPSQTLLAEKNHYSSMDQEICLILAQVSLSLLY